MTERQPGKKPEEQLDMPLLFDRRDVGKAGVAIPLGLIVFAVARYLDIIPDDKSAAILGITVGAALFNIRLGIASSKHHLREAQKLIAQGEDCKAFVLGAFAKRLAGLTMAGAIVGVGFSPHGGEVRGAAFGILTGAVLSVVEGIIGYPRV